MLTVSKLLFSLLLLIVCACSSNTTPVDKDLFLGSSEAVTGAPTPDFFSVIPRPRKSDNISFLLFNHFKDLKSEECKIASNVTSHNKKICIAEVNELDLYVHGLEIEVNVPPGMCKYLAIDNYWYYNHKPGRVNTSVQITGTITTTGTTWDCVAGCDSPTQSNPDVQFDVTAGTVSCQYDYSADGDPNCCFGSYSLQTTLIDNTNNPPLTTIENETLDWGGDLSACISGPGSIPAWPKSSASGLFFGVPARLISDTRARGIKHLVDVPAPINQEPQNRLNVFASNFYTGALETVAVTNDLITYPHYHEVQGGYSKTPVAVKPTARVPQGNDAYRFLCLDEAYEVLQQINVYVREWNTVEKYTEYVSDVNNLTPEPDIGGKEDTNCGYFESGAPCNDYQDWDNLTGQYPGQI